MDPSIVAVHVKTQDRVKVLDALREAMKARGLVPPPGGGDDDEQDDDDAPGTEVVLLAAPRGAWTTLYPDPAAPDPRGLAGGVAAAAGAPALLLGRLDEDAFFYAAFDDKGRLGDEYHSCPDYAREVDEDDAPDAEVERTRGDPSALAAALGAGGDAAKGLGELLAKARIEHLRDYDPNAGLPDVERALAGLARALRLSALPATYEDVCADAEEGGAGLHRVAFRPPPEPKRGLKLPWPRRGGGDR